MKKLNLLLLMLAATLLLPLAGCGHDEPKLVDYMYNGSEGNYQARIVGEYARIVGDYNKDKEYIHVQVTEAPIAETAEYPTPANHDFIRFKKTDLPIDNYEPEMQISFHIKRFVTEPNFHDQCCTYWLAEVEPI